MAFQPKAPPPVPALPSKKKEKTPKQVAQRRYATQQAYKNLPGVQQQEFNQRYREYDDIYKAYHGGRLDPGYARKLIAAGISFTAFSRYLTSLPAFYKSQVWKQQAEKFYGPARNMGMKVNKKMVAQAIANNWDPYVFQEKLRQRPGYLASTEFKTMEAGMTNSFRSLYGTPDAEWQKVIKRAALARWTEEQWKSYLRTQPGYKNSTEFQGHMSNIRSLLGFTSPYTGTAPGKATGKVPADKRVPY